MYFPESFEWIILKSGTVTSSDINDVLNNPELYIESAEYLSWERFFTDYLRRVTADDPIRRYNKDRLAEFYTGGQAMKDILSVLPESIRHL